MCIRWLINFSVTVEFPGTYILPHPHDYYYFRPAFILLLFIYSYLFTVLNYQLLVAPCTIDSVLCTKFSVRINCIRSSSYRSFVPLLLKI